MFRIKITNTPGYWTVEEYISNAFGGAWHAILTSSYDYCANYVKRHK